MNCRKARKLIPLSAGGDLDPETEAAVLGHAAECRECGRLLDEFRRQTAMIGSAFSVPAPGIVSGAAERALEAARKGAQPARPAKPYARRIEFILPAAAAAAILLLAAVHFADLALRSPDPQAGGRGTPAAGPVVVAAAGLPGPAEAGLVVENRAGGQGGYPIAEIGVPGDSVPVLSNLPEDSAGRDPGDGESKFLLDEIEHIEDVSVSVDF